MATPSVKYNFNAVVEWQGRVIYKNMELVSISSYYVHTGNSTLLPALESVRSSLPSHLSNLNFRNIEYYTFREEVYSGSEVTGSTSKTLVIPVLFVDALEEVEEGNQPQLLINPVNRAQFNLVSGVLRDLNVSFEVSE